MPEQNRIRFRDLEQSREKWRNEALSLRQTMVWQEKKLEGNKKELIAVKEELRNLTENHVKKTKNKRTGVNTLWLGRSKRISLFLNHHTFSNSNGHGRTFPSPRCNTVFSSNQ